MTTAAVTPEGSIAIIGMAGRFPKAPDIEAFWKNLRTGIEAVTTFTDDALRQNGVRQTLLDDPHYVKSGAVLEEVDLFDADFFGFSPRDAAIMDPQHRHFLECCWHALEHAATILRDSTDRSACSEGLDTTPIWRSICCRIRTLSTRSASFPSATQTTTRIS